MLKRKSVVALIIISFWFFYTILTVTSFVATARESFHDHTQLRKNVVDFNLETAAHFLMTEKTKALLPRLQRAREIKEFDFFLLRKNGEVLDYYNKDNNLEGINHDYQVINQFQETDTYILKTLNIHDYKLTLGIVKAESSYILYELKRGRFGILLDLTLVTLLVAAIVYLILKDILQLSKILSSSDRGNLQGVQSVSKEGEVLLKASRGFEELNQSLKNNNLLIMSSLGPAIRHELKLGKAPPYPIQCTLARVDLNGYTQLFLQEKPEVLFYILSTYFQRSRELIERYHGLIYQYVGDEIIFLIKEDQGTGSSARMALAAIRSLFEMGKELITPEVPNGLRLKASLVTGTLQFVKMDQGHSFSGLPLIESVRMLGQVSEKNDNSLIIYAESLAQLDKLCEPNEQRTAVFKGFATESQLLDVRKFTSLHTALSTLPLSLVTKYYRSDKDIQDLLAHMKNLILQAEWDDFFNLISGLRDLHLQNPGPNIAQAYQQILESCFAINMHKLTDSKAFSALISLGQNLLAPQVVSPDLQGLLVKADTSADPRVRANAVITMSALGIEIPDLQEKFYSSNNRLAADAIFVAGQKEFTEVLYSRLNEFIHSDQPKFVASALYLIAALIDYHRERDMVYLKTNPHLKALALQIMNFTSHPDPMIQARAQKSLEIVRHGGYLET